MYLYRLFFMTIGFGLLSPAMMQSRQSSNEELEIQLFDESEQSEYSSQKHTIYLDEPPTEPLCSICLDTKSSKKSKKERRKKIKEPAEETETAEQVVFEEAPESPQEIFLKMPEESIEIEEESTDPILQSEQNFSEPIAPQPQKRTKTKSRKNSWKVLSIQEATSIKNELYPEKRDAFTIPEQEKDPINKTGGDDTYGYMPDSSNEKIVAALKAEGKIGPKTVMMDLGSGDGAVVVYWRLRTNIKEGRGVEMSKKRCDMAEKVARELQNRGLVDAEHTLVFECGNMLEADVHDVDIFYTCSTCFGSKLMQPLMEKLSKLKNGVILLTLIELPEGHEKYGWQLIPGRKGSRAWMTEPMSWSPNGSAIYRYDLTK